MTNNLDKTDFKPNFEWQKQLNVSSYIPRRDLFSVLSPAIRLLLGNYLNLLKGLISPFRAKTQNMLITCATIKISLQILKECTRPWEQLCLWTAPFNKHWCLIWLLLGWSKLNTFTEIICSMTKITQLITLFFSEGVVNGQCETL